MTITLNDEVEEHHFLDPRDHQISRQWIIILCETEKEKVYRTKMNTRWMLIRTFGTYLIQFSVAKTGTHCIFFNPGITESSCEMFAITLFVAHGNVKTSLGNSTWKR